MRKFININKFEIHLRCFGEPIAPFFLFDLQVQLEMEEQAEHSSLYFSILKKIHLSVVINEKKRIKIDMKSPVVI